MPDPFHLAFPVHDLVAARAFYGGLLGCAEGRNSDRWVDYDFFGHQLVAHLVDGMTGGTPAPPETSLMNGVRTVPPTPVPPSSRPSNRVDGHDVPVPHFGVVLPMDEWTALAARLREAGVAFVIEPYIRFKGEPGEQATMFLHDPSGNALEFKAFADLSNMFAKA